MSAPHLGWKRIERHAQDRIEELRLALETVPADHLVRLQAEIAVWRQVMILPETLSDEQIAPESAGYN